jgi:hypothetical protein
LKSGIKGHGNKQASRSRGYFNVQTLTEKIMRLKVPILRRSDREIRLPDGLTVVVYMTGTLVI